MSEEAVSEYFPFNLLVPRPSSDLKLAWSWPDLAIETKVATLQRIEEHFDLRETHQATIWTATQDINQYVRYQALRLRSVDHFPFDINIITEPEVYLCFMAHFLDGYCFQFINEGRNQIEEDLREEEAYARLVDIFPRLRYFHMVALLSTNQIPPKWFHEIIKNCYHANRISRDNQFLVFLLVSEYVRSRVVQLLRPSAFSSSKIEEDLNFLWDLVPVLPEKAAEQLIRNLPSGTGLLAVEFIESLDEWRKTFLLARKDIIRHGVRMEYFEKILDEGGTIEKLSLFNEECVISERLFQKILDKPSREKGKLLQYLYLGKVKFSLVQNAVTQDLVGHCDDFLKDSISLGLSLRFEERIDLLEGNALKDEILELYTYFMAKHFLSRESDQRERRNVFEEEKRKFVVENDPWRTFVNMKVAFYSGWRPSDESVDVHELLPLCDGPSFLQEYSDEQIRKFSFLDQFYTEIKKLKVHRR